MFEQEKDKFFSIRGKVLDAINRQRRRGEPGKMSDGNMEITMYVDADGVVQWRFWLYCYLIGPGRRYEWLGNNLMKVLEKAEEAIDEFIREADDD